MQLKTRRCHLTPFRLAVYKNQKVTSVDEDGEAGTLVRSRWGCKLVPPPGNRVWRFLKKSKAKLPYDKEIPPLGIYPKVKAASQREICPHLCSQQHHSQSPRGANQRPKNGWVGNKTWSIRITEHPSALRRKEFCHRLPPGWNLRDILSKINASHKNRQVLYDSTYMGYVSQIHRNGKWKDSAQLVLQEKGKRGKVYWVSFSLGNWKSFEDQLYNHVNSRYTVQLYDFKNCQNGKFYIMCCF